MTASNAPITRKLWNMKKTVIPIVIGALGTIRKGFEKGLERVGNWRMNRGHQVYSIVEIGQNTEKCPRDLRRIAVIRFQVKDH